MNDKERVLAAMENEAVKVAIEELIRERPTHWFKYSFPLNFFNFCFNLNQYCHYSNYKYLNNIISMKEEFLFGTKK